MKSFFKNESVCYLLLFVVFFLLTYHTIKYGFIYDDRYLIVDFLEIPFHSLRKAMYEYADFHFYPVYFISHLIDNFITLQFFELENYLDPKRWVIPRSTNLFLHFISSILLFKLTKKIFNTDNNIIISISTLFFLIHPMVSQPVFNVTARNELLYLVFGLGAFLYSFKFIENNNLQNSLKVNVLIFLSLCSKALSVYFIFLIPFFHFLKVFEKKGAKKDYEKVLSLFITLVLTLILFLVIRDYNTRSYHLVIDNGIFYNLLSGLTFYSQNLIFPIEHLYTVVETRIFSMGIYCLLLLVLIFFYSIYILIKKNDVNLFYTFVWIGSSLAIPVYFGLLTPNSFPLLTELAERYSYGSIPAISLLVAFFLIKLSKLNFKLVYAYPFVAFILFFYAFLITERSYVYKDDGIFWGKASLTHHIDHLYFKVVPGYYFMKKKEHSKALLYFYENTYIYKNSVRNYGMLSKVYEEINRPNVSKYYLDYIENNFGGHPMLLMKKGSELLNEKKYEEAIIKFEGVEKIYYDEELWKKVPDLEKYDVEIFQYQPDDVFYSMGICYSYLGNKKKAFKYFRKAFKYNFKHASAKFNAGIIAKDLGDKNLAIKLINEAVNQNPKLKRIMNEKLDNKI